MLKGRLPGEFYEALTAYAGYYLEVHGEAIDLWPLLIQMPRAFVAAGPRVPRAAAAGAGHSRRRAGRI